MTARRPAPRAGGARLRAGLRAMAVVALMAMVPLAGRAEGPQASPRPEGRPSAAAAVIPVAGSRRLLAPLASPRPLARRPAAEAPIPRRGGDGAAAPAIRPPERSLAALAEQRSARAAALEATRPAGRLSSVSARTAAPVRAPAAGGGLLQRIFAPGPARPGRDQTLGRSSDRLAGLAGVSGEAIPPIRGRIQGCGIAQPLRVTAVAGVALRPPATLDREAAAALAEWTRAVAIPAVGRRGGGLAELKVASAYACRARNSVPGARLSEHAAGRAIDITGFTLRDGTVLSVAEHYRRGRHAEVLRAAHRGACGPFGTTLGPGSDGRHEDHLHFDVARPGGNAYCR